MTEKLLWPGEKPSRRGVLKKGLLGGALLALGGGGFLAFRRSAEEEAPKEGLTVLSPREYAVFAALARRLVPARAGWPTTDELRVALLADRILAAADVTAQQELKGLLGLFENALSGFLFGRRTRPFTQLEASEQDAVLDEWRNSGLTLRRSGYLALRMVVLAAYYASPRTWAAVGYDGPPKGVHDPAAPVWKGRGEPRPVSFGRWYGDEPVQPVAPGVDGAAGSAGAPTDAGAPLGAP